LLLMMLLARIVSTYENTSVTLPATSPEVSDTCRVHALCAVCIPETVLHCTELSDVQPDISLLLPPTRACPLESASPMLAPSTVTLIAPVLTQFDTSTLLGVGPMDVKTSDTLPPACPDVNATQQLNTVPAALLQCTELSDVQTVIVPRLPPRRKQAVWSTAPILAPSTVTLIAPVLAQFDASTLLGIGPMNVKVSDTLPTASPDVNAPQQLRTTPAVPLQPTELADVHTVASPRLAPTREHML
jgi:hypothetical protein